VSTGGWAVVALVVYVVGLVLAFGLRTWVHWRATGTTGFRGISGRRGSVAWWGGVGCCSRSLWCSGWARRCSR
jgi:hypothetical protein